MRMLIIFSFVLTVVEGCTKSYPLSYTEQTFSETAPSLQLNFPSYAGNASQIQCSQTADTVTLTGLNTNGSLFIQFISSSRLADTLYVFDSQNGKVVFYDPFGYPIGIFSGNFQIYFNSVCNGRLTGWFNGNMVASRSDSLPSACQGSFSDIPYSYNPF